MPPVSRFNEIGIQMLSRPLWKQLFPESMAAIDNNILDISKSHLEKHGLLGKTLDPLKDLNIKLPKLISQDPEMPSIEDHFHALGLEQQRPYLAKVKRLASITLPPKPKNWQMVPGWVKYNNDGSFCSIKVMFIKIGTPERGRCCFRRGSSLQSISLSSFWCSCI